MIVIMCITPQHSLYPKRLPRFILFQETNYGLSTPSFFIHMSIETSCGCLCAVRVCMCVCVCICVRMCVNVFVAAELHPAKRSLLILIGSRSYLDQSEEPYLLRSHDERSTELDLRSGDG